jgi:hypothetical protein
MGQGDAVVAARSLPLFIVLVGPALGAADEWFVRLFKKCFLLARFRLRSLGTQSRFCLEKLGIAAATGFSVVEVAPSAAATSTP